MLRVVLLVPIPFFQPWALDAFLVSLVLVNSGIFWLLLVVCHFRREERDGTGQTVTAGPGSRRRNVGVGGVPLFTQGICGLET